MENRDLYSTEALHLEPLTKEQALHLEPLTKEQAEGFFAFKQWFLSDRRLGVLKGVGGSGKTFAITQWVKAVGLKPTTHKKFYDKDKGKEVIITTPGEVTALAPTHKAVEAIKESLHKKDFECECMTIHKALGWTSEQITWGKDEEEYLLELRMDKSSREDAFDYEYIKENLNPEIRRLTRAKEAVRKEELIFGPGKYRPHIDSKLLLVDECSMISEEIYDALVITFNKSKILFIGDDEQLFPVGEGMSKTFDEPETLAEFLQVQRNEGELRNFNLMLRGGDVDTMHTLCQGIKPTEDAISDAKAATITKDKAKDLARKFLETLKWDGYEFRVLFYKNKTIENFSVYAKKFAQEDWKVGDYASAYKTISVWCGYEDYTDGAGMNRRRSIIETALKTDTPSEIKSIDEGKLVSVIGPNGEAQIKVFRAAVIVPEFKRHKHKIASLSSHLKKDWVYPKSHTSETDSVVVSLVSFEDFKRYREIFEQWKNIRRVLYSRAHRPSKNTEGAKLLFKTLGIESWTQIPNTPGYERFSVEDLRGLEGAKFLRFDEITPKKDKEGNSYEDMPVDYYRLRTAVDRYYYWINDLHDPIRLRIASTVHKAQGETIDRVLMHLPELYESRSYGQDGPDNARRAIYTAASRASKQLYIIN